MEATVTPLALSSITRFAPAPAYTCWWRGIQFSARDFAVYAIDRAEFASAFPGEVPTRENAHDLLHDHDGSDSLASAIREADIDAREDWMAERGAE